MESKCHRYDTDASANSFSKNFKIIGVLDWERKNYFLAGNICRYHSMAVKSDSHLVLICDNNCPNYIAEFAVTLEIFRSYCIYREITVNLHYDAFCVHRQCICFMLYAAVKDACWTFNTD
jgi:hypothetical protein